MVFENGVKNIQAAAYNGARTVINDLESACVSYKYQTQIKMTSNLTSEIEMSA